MQYWLMKSEPESYSIRDLAREPTKTTHWDGVRNYQARNFMRSMQIGDRVLFYHSNAEPPAVVGTATVAKTAYPDFTALDPSDHHYDPKSTQENPIWEMVDVRFEGEFARPIPLDALRANDALEGLELLRRGSRLSVIPVSAEHFQAIVAMADGGTGDDTAPAACTASRRKSPQHKPARRAQKALRRAAKNPAARK